MWLISKTLQATPSLKDALTASSPSILVSLCHRCKLCEASQYTRWGQKISAYLLSTKWDGLEVTCRLYIVSAGIAHTSPNRLRSSPSIRLLTCMKHGKCNEIPPLALIAPSPTPRAAQVAWEAYNIPATNDFSTTTNLFPSGPLEWRSFLIQAQNRVPVNQARSSNVAEYDNAETPGALFTFGNIDSPNDNAVAFARKRPASRAGSFQSGSTQHTGPQCKSSLSTHRHSWLLAPVHLPSSGTCN